MAQLERVRRDEQSLQLVVDSLSAIAGTELVSLGERVARFAAVVGGSEACMAPAPGQRGESIQFLERRRTLGPRWGAWVTDLTWRITAARLGHDRHLERDLVATATATMLLPGLAVQCAAHPYAPGTGAVLPRDVRPTVASLARLVDAFDAFLRGAGEAPPAVCDEHRARARHLVDHGHDWLLRFGAHVSALSGSVRDARLIEASGRRHGAGRARSVGEREKAAREELQRMMLIPGIAWWCVWQG